MVWVDAKGNPVEIASMEPLFFKAENVAVSEIEDWDFRGFNGAAFFQSGKCPSETDEDTAILHFNGAAFFQSGKSN